MLWMVGSEDFQMIKITPLKWHVKCLSLQLSQTSSNIYFKDYNMARLERSTAATLDTPASSLNRVYREYSGLFV